MKIKLPLSSPGYTLIELVVALLLLSLIALAVQSGLHFGGQVWQRSQQRLAAANQLDTSQAILRETLSQALPRFKGEYVTFMGEPSTLSFDCVPPLAFQSKGTARVTLSITPISGKLTLKLASLADASATRNVVLLEGVKQLRFSYLDVSQKSAVWLSYWRDHNRLPDAIRIASDDPTQWPTLIVKPIIAQDANCVLDPVSMTCRTS